MERLGRGYVRQDADRIVLPPGIGIAGIDMVLLPAQRLQHVAWLLVDEKLQAMAVSGRMDRNEPRVAVRLLGRMALVAGFGNLMHANATVAESERQAGQHGEPKRSHLPVYLRRCAPPCQGAGRCRWPLYRARTTTRCQSGGIWLQM